MPNRPELIEGLILCGGKAERMGGVDKGLIKLKNKPLVTWVAEKLAPQVSCVSVNANRCIDEYEALRFKVLPDVIKGFAGPLAGFHAGLKNCKLPYLLVAPCDSPLLPNNLVHQLHKTLSEKNLDIVYAATSSKNPEHLIQTHPVFCLMKKDVLPSLEAFLDSGDRKIDRWFKKLKSSAFVFSDENAFSNINTPEELENITHLLP
jgi:molybdopterin-guanine dinucleotide biosynthesis protein A